MALNYEILRTSTYGMKPETKELDYSRGLWIMWLLEILILSS